MIRYRKATLGDIPKVAELLVFVWQSSYHSFLPEAFLSSLSIEHQRKRHEKIFNSHISYYLCEDESKNILAFCSFGAPRSRDSIADLEIYTIYVHPDAQRKGIGKAFLEFMESQTKAILEVMVMEGNPFLSFYLKHGFERQSVVDLDLGLIPVKAGIYLKKTS